LLVASGNDQPGSSVRRRIEVDPIALRTMTFWLRKMRISARAAPAGSIIESRSATGSNDLRERKPSPRLVDTSDAFHFYKGSEFHDSKPLFSRQVSCYFSQICKFRAGDDPGLH
jgi:hypothetical protein